MTTLQQAEQLLVEMSPNEKMQLLQRIARDLSNAKSDIESPLSGHGSESHIVTADTTFTENQAKKNYYTVISRILDLLLEDEIDDEYGGEVIPTEYAVNRVLAILSNTYEILRTTFPKAAASTSFDGGIRVQWMYPRFSVRLVIPGTPAQDEYIFFEDEETYGSEKVSVETLATKLMWLERVLRHVEIA